MLPEHNQSLEKYLEGLFYMVAQENFNIWLISKAKGHSNGDGRLGPSMTYRHSVSGHVIFLATFNHLLEVRTVMGLTICYDNHHFFGSLPPTFLKGFGAESYEERTQITLLKRCQRSEKETHLHQSEQPQCSTILLYSLLPGEEAFPADMSTSRAVTVRFLPKVSPLKFGFTFWRFKLLVLLPNEILGILLGGETLGILQFCIQIDCA